LALAHDFAGWQGAYRMPSAVRGSGLALRALWALNLVIGLYIAYFATGNSRPWVITHVFTGVLIVALLWFLGVAQALVPRGSLVLTSATFLVGLTLALIGAVQIAIPDGLGLTIVQLLHIILVVSAIALGEICIRRYRDGLASQAA
jgi:hypothetical protein